MTKHKEITERMLDVRSNIIFDIKDRVKERDDYLDIMLLINDLLLNEWRLGYVEGIEVMNTDKNDGFYDTLIKKLKANDSKI